jgi:hypothetical protein
MELMPKRQLGLKDAIQFKIDSARQCQLGRRSRPPQSLPSSWHSSFYGPFLLIYSRTFLQRRSFTLSFHNHFSLIQCRQFAILQQHISVH